VVLFVAFVGVVLASLHVPDGRGRVVLPGWFDPPVAGAEARDEEPRWFRDADVAMPSTEGGDSAEQPICDKVADTAPPVSAMPPSAANHTDIPC
jgi:hypothetical protein